jgi:hypothetical protein
MLFRHSHATSLWHFCQNCSAWPEKDFAEETIEPPKNLLCTECTRRLTDLQCEAGAEEGIS